jgi:hypothetical protein
MPATNYLSKLTLNVKVNDVVTPVEYTLKDAEARELIEQIGHAIYWIGVTTDALTDGATTNPITVNSESVTAKLGGMASYNGSEFVWNGTAWQEMGKNNFGALAFKSSASGSYTPAGTVAITQGTDTTDSVTGIASVGTLPDAYFTVSGETATFNWSAGTLPEADASAKTFITARGTDTAAFTGTEATITVE